MEVECFSIFGHISFRTHTLRIRAPRDFELKSSSVFMNENCLLVYVSPLLASVDINGRIVDSLGI